MNDAVVQKHERIGKTCGSISSVGAVDETYTFVLRRYRRRADECDDHELPPIAGAGLGWNVNELPAVFDETLIVVDFTHSRFRRRVLEFSYSFRHQSCYTKSTYVSKYGAK